MTTTGTSARWDAVVVGGGFTGIATAVSLARQGREVLVLEARTGPSPVFRGELIHPPGVQGLRALGFFDELRSRGGVEVTGFAVIPDLGSDAVELPYEPAPFGQGHGFALEHHAIVDAMRAVARRDPRITMQEGERVVAVLREGGRVAGVRTARGAEVRARLTLVCEGRHSKLRALLGLEAESTLLSYSAALLARGAALPYAGRGHVVIGPPGPVLAYPIGGAVRFCIDMPADTDRGRDAIARRLREEYAPALPAALADALRIALADDTLELCASQQLRTRACAVPGAALVGDAGGCSHPITATGMTSSLNDVRALTLCLDDARDDAAVDAALQRYERTRYRYIRAREILTERLYDVFLGNDDGLRALRDGMLAYWKDTSRARVASMALLSGQSHGAIGFAREFARVYGYAAAAAFTPRRPATLAQRARAFARMTEVTWATLRRAASTAAAELRR